MPFLPPFPASPSLLSPTAAPSLECLGKEHNTKRNEKGGKEKMTLLGVISMKTPISWFGTLRAGHSWGY